MIKCFFCGSDVTLGIDDKPKDRYFIDKRDKKAMCKLCSIHYAQRQTFELHPSDDGSINEADLADFVLKNFEKVMLQSSMDEFAVSK